MTRETKKEALRRLVDRGEIFCAEVCAMDWHMTNYLEKLKRSTAQKETDSIANSCCNIDIA